MLTWTLSADMVPSILHRAKMSHRKTKKEVEAMPRIARMIVKGEPAVYHVMSRTALNGYVLGDVEKEYLFKLIKRLSAVYFTEIIGYALMGNHFHLLVRMLPGEDFSDNEIKKRFTLLYGNDSDRKPLRLYTE